MEKRTNIQFISDFEIWPAVEKWAIKNEFILKETNGNERTYQKGVGFLVAPMMLKIASDNNRIDLEAWIRVSFFTRLMGFFILPAEMGVRSGGFKGVVPRNIARNAINELLIQLRQPEIK